MIAFSDASSRDACSCGFITNADRATGASYCPRCGGRNDTITIVIPPRPNKRPVEPVEPRNRAEKRAAKSKRKGRR